MAQRQDEFNAVPRSELTRSDGLILGLFAALLFAITSSGKLPADPESRYDVAVRALDEGRLSMPGPGINSVESGGLHYCVFFPGQSIVFAPAAAVAVAAERVGVGASTAGLAGGFLAVTVVTPVIGGLAVVGLSALLGAIGVSQRVALLGGVLLATATPLWVNAGLGSEEAVLAAATCWGLYAWVRARAALTQATTDEGVAARHAAVLRWLGIGALCFGVGLLHRGTYLAVVVGALCVVPWMAMWRAGLAQPVRAVAWLLPCAGCIAMVLAYNAARFGHPFDTGYGRFYARFDEGLYGHPLWKGLVGYAVSPGKSVFLYAPVLLLSVAAVLDGRVWRHLGRIAAVIVVATVIHLMFYAPFTFWGGDTNWGVRFHVGMMPLWIIPAVVGVSLWWTGQRARALARGTIVAVVAVSVAVQLAGLSLNWGLEQRQRPEAWVGPPGYRLVPADAAWTWDASPWRRRWVNLADKLSGRPLLAPHASPEERESYEAWNIFPLFARAKLGRGALFWALAGVWGVLALLTIASGVLLWRRVKDAHDGGRGDPPPR
ncbi:MAG: hypothetical protein AAGK09_11710 [Planctomycetota bacterium]